MYQQSDCLTRTARFPGVTKRCKMFDWDGILHEIICTLAVQHFAALSTEITPKYLNILQNNECLSLFFRLYCLQPTAGVACVNAISPQRFYFPRTKTQKMLTILSEVELHYCARVKHIIYPQKKKIARKQNRGKDHDIYTYIF